MAPEAAEIIERLRLQPHPEGGHYAETYRHQPPGGGRGALTAIYYLLAAGEESRWHRVKDATEVWLYHAGGPLELRLSPDGKRSEVIRLGPEHRARRAAAGDRALELLAGGAAAWALGAGDLHRGAGIRIRRLRDGAAGLGARPLAAA